MRIGITFDLKSDGCPPRGAPDDWQEEFDSLATIEAIAQVLRGLGHDVSLLGNGPGMVRQLVDHPPDFVFNFAEGQGVGRSREARVPALLELLDIPHSGSDPLTLAATLDKDVAKKLVAGCSPWLRVPRSSLVADDQPLAECPTFPVILKPAWEGSSKGIRGRCVVDSPRELDQELARMRRDYRQPILVEEYIQGDELTVGIVGNGETAQVLGIMRVVPRSHTDRFVYSLEVKRDYLDLVSYEAPPPYAENLLDRIEHAALAAYHALGCRDVARIDFRLVGDLAYFIEANPLPGLNPESSDLCIMARLVGWTYPQLIEAIWQAACSRVAVRAESVASTSECRVPSLAAAH